jgi:hypothetical protein
VLGNLGNNGRDCVHLLPRRQRPRADQSPFEPADPAFTQAIAALQWGLKHNRKIGQSGRYDRRAFWQLMQIVLRLPPPDQST